MGKSTNGPDWQDCSVLIREFEDRENCSVTLLLDVPGSGGGGIWHIHGLAVEQNKIDREDAWTTACTLVWPNRVNKTFEGAIFRVVYHLEWLREHEQFQETLNLT